MRPLLFLAILLLSILGIKVMTFAGTNFRDSFLTLNIRNPGSVKLNNTVSFCASMECFQLPGFIFFCEDPDDDDQDDLSSKKFGSVMANHFVFNKQTYLNYKQNSTAMEHSAHWNAESQKHTLPGILRI
jgi:hypothetical protein